MSMIQFLVENSSKATDRAMTESETNAKKYETLYIPEKNKKPKNIICIPKERYSENLPLGVGIFLDFLMHIRFKIDNGKIIAKSKNPLAA